MVAVTIGVIDEIVLMLLMGGVEYCAFPNVCGDALLLVAAEVACIDPLLVIVKLIMRLFVIKTKNGRQ